MGLIILYLAATFFVLGRSAPTNYDQRQDGKVNVHADLENFLFVFATAPDTNLLNEFAAQALEQTLTLRHGSSKEQAQAGTTAAKYEVEDTQDKSKEPYRVEIVRIERDEDKKSRKTEHQGDLAELGDEGSKDKDKAQEGGEEDPKSADKPVEAEEKEKKGRSLPRLSHARTVQDDGKAEEDKKPEQGKAEEEKGGEREKGGKARNVWTRVADPGRPGQSLKKELSRKESERDKNDVGSQNKPQELMLLGEGIENCGPGRFRDRAGVCQVDESFN